MLNIKEDLLKNSLYSDLLYNHIKEKKDPNAYMVASVIQSQLKFQGRGVSLSTQAFALNLFMRIFEIEGISYHLLEPILGRYIDKEMQMFVNWLNS